MRAYLEQTGIERADPSLELLEHVASAHGRTFPFANVDVLLRRHPGVEPATASRRLLVEHRGGYCYEHSQLMAAVLEDLGFDVTRHLGRVHSAENTRTHMSLSVLHDGRR